ncbi:MAG: PLP-dependent aminotransferase family protein, partial [Dinoroseobacter sp.]|nr:PLP-dependent aminotransferase family protein [Dinoroseobacter sp.]
MNTIWSDDLSKVLSSASGPKYTRLAKAIEAGISQGALAPGSKLPPVRDLAYRLSVTPGTVARAYSKLVDAGVLEAGVGRGTFVAEAVQMPVASSIVEVDSVLHGTGGDSYEVNLISPHLPHVGQARLIREVLSKVAETPPSGVLHYPGHETGRTAREAVHSYLSDVTLGPLSPEDIVLSHGAQNGVMIVMQAVLSGRRPVVLVEELAYPGYRRAAELLRAEVLPVPMDEEGLIPEALEAVAKSSGAQLLCMSAEVQNPLLLTVPPRRRAAIADVARRTGLQVLEDDTYRLGNVSGPSMRALLPERGWYVNSLSKSLSPALRFGFVVAPERGVAPLRRAAEAGFFGIATPISDLTAMLLTHPDLPAIQQNVRDAVASYIRSIVNALGRYDLVWREDALFAWLNLPSGWRAGAFARAAEGKGVLIRT